MNVNQNAKRYPARQRGFGLVELLIAMEEMGRALLCSPFLGTAVFATNALLECADETTQKDLLAAIAAGKTTLCVAHAEPDQGWDLDAIAMQATKTADGFSLSGGKAWVLDGHSADVVLVVARNEDGLALFRVAGDASGLQRRPAPAFARAGRPRDSTPTPARGAPPPIPSHSPLQPKFVVSGSPLVLRELCYENLSHHGFL